MKRKEIMKTLSISGLALVIASSMLLSGCGSEEAKNSTKKDVAIATEVSKNADESKADDKKDTKDTVEEKDTEKDELQVTEEAKAEEAKDSDSKDEKSDKADTDKSGTSGSSSNSGNSGSNNSGSTGGNSSSGNTSNGGNSNSGNTSNGNSNSGNTSNGGNTSGGTSSSTTPTHTHNWIPITQTVHHPAETKQVDQGHYETITDSPVWDEEVPVMEYCTYCATCKRNTGELVILRGQQEVHDHVEWHYNNGDYSVQTKSEDVQVGTDVIHYPAVTHEAWVPNIVTVTIKEAWDEVVTVGYQCSECGATK